MDYNFDELTGGIFGDVLVHPDGTPRADRAYAALPAFDAGSPFNATSFSARQQRNKAADTASYLVSPIPARHAPLGQLANGYGQVATAQDFQLACMATNFDTGYTEEPKQPASTLGLGLTEEAVSGLASIDYSKMRIFGLPISHDAQGNRVRHTSCDFLPYPENLPTVTLGRGKKNVRDVSPMPEGANGLSNSGGSIPVNGPSPPSMVPSIAVAPPPRTTTTKRNKKSLTVKTKEDGPRSAKRVKSMPAMREQPRSPTAAPPMPSVVPTAPQVPFNSPLTAHFPPQLQDMPFAFSDFYNTGLVQGGSLDMGTGGGDGRELSPTDFSADMFGTLSDQGSATSATFDFNSLAPTLGGRDDAMFIHGMPTPNLLPSSALSTPTTNGFRSPLLSPSGHYPSFAPFDQSFNAYLGAQYAQGTSVVQQQQQQQQQQNYGGWSSNAGIPASAYASIDGILAQQQQQEAPTSPQPIPVPQQRPARQSRAVSRKRSRAMSYDEDDDGDSRGGDEDDEDFVFSDDVEVEEDVGSDGDYAPAMQQPVQYFGGRPAASSAVGRAVSASGGFRTLSFKTTNAPPVPPIPSTSTGSSSRPLKRVVSAPPGRLRPGPKPKRSVADGLGRQGGAHIPVMPKVEVVVEALRQAGADPSLALAAPEEIGSDAEAPMENGTSALPKGVITSLYTTVNTKDGKRYRCLMAGCDRHFPRKSAIESHIQTHLEDKPFVCPDSECGASFVRQHDLRRHERIHSGRKPFECACGKGFARGDALMRHRQRGICEGSLVPRRS